MDTSYNKSPLLKFFIMNINDQYFESILKDIGFYDFNYPKTHLGLTHFLNAFRIQLIVYEVADNQWNYAGVDRETNNHFTQDLNDYKSFEECVENGIVECCAYLSLKKHG
jgi:hypothetical protein